MGPACREGCNGVLSTPVKLPCSAAPSFCGLCCSSAAQGDREFCRKGRRRLRGPPLLFRLAQSWLIPPLALNQPSLQPQAMQLIEQLKETAAWHQEAESCRETSKGEAAEVLLSRPRATETTLALSEALHPSPAFDRPGASMSRTAPASRHQ
eukprot:scaffold2117_cov241-Pinguiococcus_pyrenoidosus.AAC.4